VEVESWGLLITMTVNRDVANAPAEQVTRFSDIGEAAAAVAAFLESLTSTELASSVSDAAPSSLYR
jgi:hypothetical protein